MQDVTLAVPIITNAFTGPVDTSTLDSSNLSSWLSSTLTPSDSFAIWASQDSSATGASPNLTYLANIAGNPAGQANLSPVFSGWRYIFLQRIQGTNPGNFYVSGNLAPVASVAPASTSLPTIVGNYTSLSTVPFRSGLRLALGANFTSSDVFDVYVADDGAATPTAGSIRVGRLQGGGSLNLGTLTSYSGNQAQAASAPSAMALAFVNVLLRRVAGSTPGNAYAWGNADATGGGGTATSIQNNPVASGAPTVVGQYYAWNGSALALTTPNALDARFSYVLEGLAPGQGLGYGAAGSSATHGGRYYTTSARLCTGCRFWWGSGNIAKTVKVALWDMNGNLVTFKTVTMSVDGIHLLNWPAPVSIAAYTRFTVSLHDTAGSGQIFVSWTPSASASPVAPVVTKPVVLGPYVVVEDPGLYNTSGDAYPNTSLMGATVIPVEPLFDVDVYTTTD